MMMIIEPLPTEWPFPYAFILSVPRVAALKAITVKFFNLKNVLEYFLLFVTTSNGGYAS